MLSMESRQAIADLAAAMLSTRPMATALGTPVQVAAQATAADPLPAANAVGRCLGYPPLTVGDGADSPFHAVLDRHLAMPDAAAGLAHIQADAEAAVRAQAERAAAADFTAFCQQVRVTSGGGVPVLGYAAGDPAAPAVLLSAPCGMPVRLVEPWMRHLARRVRVVTWESRGMFPGDGDLDAASSVAAQVNDGLAVLQALGLSGVHVAGLCGGAVVAAELAASVPSLVSSVSLWHGDFHMGERARKTSHQRNLLGLMMLATGSLKAAEDVHRVVSQSLLGSVPEDLAAQLLYPYVTPRLFLRYCRLNGAIMRHDITPTLPDVKMPVLVVTSRTDETAHPDGSVEVARGLPDAELVVRDRGDHISLFRGDPGLLSLLDDFLSAAGRVAEAGPAQSMPGRPR